MLGGLGANSLGELDLAASTHTVETVSKCGIKDRQTQTGLLPSGPVSQQQPKSNLSPGSRLLQAFYTGKSKNSYISEGFHSTVKFPEK